MDATDPSRPTPLRAPASAAGRALRTEVALLRGREVRRLFPLSIHLGFPGGDRVGIETQWPLPSSYDVGLLIELADGLIDRWVDRAAEHWAAHCAAHWADRSDSGGGHPPSLAMPGWGGWLTRPGRPHLHDVDLRVSSAVRHACAAHGQELDAFWAITRYGWVDVGTGDGREWKRLRL